MVSRKICAIASSWLRSVGRTASIHKTILSIDGRTDEAGTEGRRESDVFLNGPRVDPLTRIKKGEEKKNRTRFRPEQGPATPIAGY